MHFDKPGPEGQVAQGTEPSYGTCESCRGGYQEAQDACSARLCFDDDVNYSGGRVVTQGLVRKSRIAIVKWRCRGGRRPSPCDLYTKLFIYLLWCEYR